MKMPADIRAVDLTEAVAEAVKLSCHVGQPPVLAGALAMAAYGYRRETSDVDIVIPVVIGAKSGDVVEDAAKEMGLTVRAKHGFGGLDLRAGEVRIDVLTLDRDMPDLIPDAVNEAVESERKIALYGHSVYVVSLGHLIAMKLMAERKKDIADIVEIIKTRMKMEEWSRDSPQVRKVLTQHLGWYAVNRQLANLVEEAKAELKEE